MLELTPIVTILVLAVVVEAIIEYFVAPAIRPPLPQPVDVDAVVEAGIVAESNAAAAGHVYQLSITDGPDWRGLALRYSAAVVGVLLCIVYACDLLAIAGLTAPYPVVGQVVTGLLIGRGANYINDFADRWLAPATRLVRH